MSRVLHRAIRILLVGLASILLIAVAGIPMAIGILVIPGYWGNIAGGLATICLIFLLNSGLERAIGKQTHFNRSFHRFWEWFEKPSKKGQ